MSQPRAQLRDSCVTVLLVVAATAAYYLIPVPGKMGEGSWAVLFFVGVGVLGVLILLLRAGCCAPARTPGSAVCSCC